MRQRCYQDPCSNHNSDASFIENFVHSYVYQEGVFDPEKSVTIEVVEDVSASATEAAHEAWEELTSILKSANVVGRLFEPLTDELE